MSNFGPIDVDWHQRFHFGDPRPISAIQAIIVHTTENAPGTPAETVANYQINSQSGSYHRLVDARGRILLENTDDWFTWSTGNRGNSVGLHVSAVARAAMTRAQWLAEDAMLTGLAKTIAHWSKLHNIPLVKISAAELKAGKRGVCGHVEARDAWGSTTHWDPGPGFPYDVVLDKAKKINAGSPPPAPTPTPTPPPVDTPKETDMNDHDTNDLILDQFAGPRDEHGIQNYAGWDQLGGRTLVDAVAAIGEHLGIDGFKAPK